MYDIEWKKAFIYLTKLIMEMMQRFLIKQTSFVEKGIEYVKLLLLNMIAFIVSTVILKLDKMVLYSM